MKTNCKRRSRDRDWWIRNFNLKKQTYSDGWFTWNSKAHSKIKFTLTQNKFSTKIHITVGKRHRTMTASFLSPILIYFPHFLLSSPYNILKNHNHIFCYFFLKCFFPLSQDDNFNLRFLPCFLWAKWRTGWSTWWPRPCPRTRPGRHWSPTTKTTPPKWRRRRKDTETFDEGPLQKIKKRDSDD